MGLFKALTKAAVNVALLPVAVVTDCVTLGGVIANRRETYTETRLRKIAKLEDDL